MRNLCRGTRSIPSCAQDTFYVKDGALQEVATARCTLFEDLHQYYSVIQRRSSYASMWDGWHRLPNGGALKKDKDGVWRQMENAVDNVGLGDREFSRVSPDQDPQRTLSLLALSKLQDFRRRTQRRTRRRKSSIMNGRSEEEQEQLEDPLRSMKSSELDKVTYSETTTVKEWQLACKGRGLQYTGSKKLLARLVAFKVDLGNKLQ